MAWGLKEAKFQIAVSGSTSLCGTRYLNTNTAPWRYDSDTALYHSDTDAMPWPIDMTWGINMAPWPIDTNMGY
ncbi:hypothetical protein EDB89DRAFT_2067948 [Lactarius sanguifluus]|nr:hypothetical protein EDB89DRAFT_2067948 [Lactarius sanguifluus]